MGRVTFLDAEVAARINRDYVATWKNVQPGYRVEHLEGERFEEIKKIPNGQASENVVTLVCTVDGELLHVVAGHWKPKDYIAELDFALTVAEAAAKSAEAEARRKAVADRHRERLAAIERRWDAGELGRRVLVRAHQRMIEQPLRPATEVRGVTDYAIETHGGPPDSLQRKLQRLNEALVRRIEPLLLDGKFDEAEKLIDRLIERIEKD